MYLAEHPLCERCLQAGRAEVAEHVHHKIELTESNYKDPMISLNPENLEALCFNCHSKEHHQGEEIGKEFYFDSDGNVCQKNDEQPGAVSQQKIGRQLDRKSYKDNEKNAKYNFF